MFTTTEIVFLVLIATLGHVLAGSWYLAAHYRWKICARTIYDLPVSEKQIKRELRNSLYTPLDAVILAAFLLIGCFQNRSLPSFLGTALVATVWAEIWHYGSHRALHLKALHWIHAEHHASAVTTPFTAISFSLAEKLFFNVGLLVPLALLDRFVGLNFYGIAVWYIAYIVINSFSHANFEVKPSRYTRWLGRVVTTTTYHSLHHARYTGNYGLSTRVLDRTFKSEWDDYEEVYEQINLRRFPMRRLREGLPD
jgi:Delta7-sterol 5-desaturase